MLKGFTIYGHDGHLGRVTKQFCINFGKLIIEVFTGNLSPIGLMISEKTVL